MATITKSKSRGSSKTPVSKTVKLAGPRLVVETPKVSVPKKTTKPGKSASKTKPPKPTKVKKSKPVLLNVRVPSEEQLAVVSEKLSKADQTLFAALLDRLTTASGSREV